MSGEDAGEEAVEGDAEGGGCYAKVEGGADVDFASFEKLESIFTEGRWVFGFAGGAVPDKESIVARLGDFEGAAGFLRGN